MANEKEAEQQTGLKERIGPTKLGEFGGQSDLVKRVSGMIAACRTRGVVFPHALLIGPIGSGRTALAHVIAREMGVSLHSTNGDAIERATDLAAIVNNLEEGDVLLIENFGRLRRPAAQRLESAMREFEFHIVVGEGLGARAMKLAVNPFALLGCVTREAECDSRLRGAFDMVLNFRPYSQDEMQTIIERAASQLGISLEGETIALIARASDGNPGKAVNITRRLLTHGDTKRLTHIQASELLHLLGVPVGNAEWSAGAVPELASLTPVDFERLIADLLRQMGFVAETTRATGDGGIDVEAVLEKPIVGGRYLFQCKRYAPDNPVGSAAVREFYGALIADRHAVKGVFITTSTFTPQAREFAQKLPIELIDGERLQALLAEVAEASK